MAKSHAPILRYWGYLLFIVLITAWWTHATGPAGLLVLSAACTLYFAFQVPVWCGADTREGEPCRRNSKGILMGCSYRQHKWQVLKGIFITRSWRKINQGLWSSPATGLATLVALSTVLSAVFSGIALVVNKS
jgi:hypothetical protein